jgi:hypothetical protein
MGDPGDGHCSVRSRMDFGPAHRGGNARSASRRVERQAPRRRPVTDGGGPWNIPAVVIEFRARARVLSHLRCRADARDDEPKDEGFRPARAGNRPRHDSLDGYEVRRTIVDFDRRRPGWPPEMHVDRLFLALVLVLRAIGAIVHATEEHEPGVLRLAKPHLAECFSAREGAAGMCVLRDTPRVRELARREGVVAVRFGVATGAERREAFGNSPALINRRFESKNPMTADRIPLKNSKNSTWSKGMKSRNATETVTE